MTAAEKAYAAAVEEIERVREAGENGINFDSDRYHALETIPPQIANIPELQALSLRNTQTADITPLQGLTGLQALYLSNTPVADITPLQGLTGLQTLSLYNTPVADITPLQGLAGMQRLSLNNSQVANVTLLQGLTRMQRLYLSNTQVADITPLQGLTEMQELDLRNTQIADITPLQGISGIQWLFLTDTQVSDIAPLLKFEQLEHLSIAGCKVHDLRPIAGQNALGSREKFGLNFLNTPAAEATPELKRISLLEDPSEAARQVKAYFKDLPPWPEPLPWEAATSTVTEPEPTVPASGPAPLQVVEADGVLRRAAPDRALDDSQDALAVGGWAALRDYLEDLSDKREAIHNSMPRLAKSMDRLDAALAEDFADINPIAVGTQGNRFIRLAKLAPEALMDEDAADVAEFAAALALFLERFPEWRAYRDDAAARPPDPAALNAALPAISEVTAELEDRREIAPEVPQSLADQTTDVVENPDDALAAKGLFASLRNVASVLANLALPALRFAKNEVGDITDKTWTGLKKNIAAGAVAGITSLAAGAADILILKAKNLHWLAAHYPSQFGWLVDFLKIFGL